MKSVVRPELPTASVGSSQAPTAAVDNSALFATSPVSTYKSGKVVQTNGATSNTNTAFLYRLLHLARGHEWHFRVLGKAWGDCLPSLLRRLAWIGKDRRVAALR